jgi:hypothetical protein
VRPNALEWSSTGVALNKLGTNSMKLPKCALKYSALLLAITSSLLGAQAPGRQSGAEGGSKNKFLETKVPDFELKNQPLLDGLWLLARGTVPFGFGFEKALKQRLSDPEIADPPLTLQLKDKSVSEILDVLCQADPRYTWSADGSTVNVFPRAIINDPTYLLNRKLARFELKNATDVQNGLLAIVRQLPPPVEQIAQAQVGGDDPYPPEPWTVTFANLTVRQVANRLAAHGGPYGIWIFGGSRDFRAFGFFNTHPFPQTLKSRTESAQP